MNPLKYIKKTLYCLLGREVFIRREIFPAMEFHGSGYGGWPVLADSLGPNSRIVSVGIGEDATFDLSLIQKYGCTVHAYDPTPKSAAWVNAKIDDPHFVFHSEGMAGTNGALRLYLPRKVNAQSASCARAKHTSDQYIDVPCLTLGTIMQRLEFDHIEVLKMDIEGSEYGVLEEALASGSLDRVGQLLVEFHHFFRAFGRRATLKALAALKARGWRIAWVSESQREVLFIRPGEPAVR